MNTQKTALELVDELTGKWMNYYPSEVCKSLAEIKEAIIYEQGKACASFAKQCNETAQADLKFRKLEQSSITMRHISELPDKVPEGCVIVAWDNRGIFAWDAGRADILKISSKYEMFGFYVLPLPLPERKLKPCPFCGAKPRPIDHLSDGNIGYYHIAHKSDCPISDCTFIPAEKADAWGWE